MTTLKNPTTDPAEQSPEELGYFDSLRIMMAPYEPVDKEGDSDKQFSTAEIISALEQHYGIPQGNTDFSLITGDKIVEFMTKLEFICINCGVLELKWIMKRKTL